MYEFTTVEKQQLNCLSKLWEDFKQGDLTISEYEVLAQAIESGLYAYE